MVFGCDLQPAPTMFSEEECDKPNAQFLLGTIFFCIFTIFGSYVLLALFVGSIGMAMDEANDDQHEEQRIQRRVKHIQATLNLNNYAISRYHDVFRMIDITDTNRIGRDELKFGLRVAGEILAESDFERLWRKVDKDKTQDVDFSEFLTFMLDMRELHLEKIRRIEAAQTESVFGGDSPIGGGRGRMKKTKSSKFDMLRGSLAGPSDQELVQEAMAKAQLASDPSAALSVAPPRVASFSALNQEEDEQTQREINKIGDLVQTIKRTMSGSKSDAKTPSFKLDMDATKMSFSKIPDSGDIELCEEPSAPRNDLELSDFDIQEDHPAQKDPMFASSKYVFGSPGGAPRTSDHLVDLMSPTDAELSAPLRASPRMKPIPAHELLSSSYKSVPPTFVASSGTPPFTVMDNFSGANANAEAKSETEEAGDLRLRNMSPTPDGGSPSSGTLPQTTFPNNSPGGHIHYSMSHDQVKGQGEGHDQMYPGYQHPESQSQSQSQPHSPVRMQKMVSTGTVDRNLNSNNSLFRSSSPVYKSGGGADVTPVRYMHEVNDYGSVGSVSTFGSEERQSRRKKYNVISVPAGNRRVKIMAI